MIARNIMESSCEQNSDSESNTQIHCTCTFAQADFSLTAEKTDIALTCRITP